MMNWRNQPGYNAIPADQLFGYDKANSLLEKIEVFYELAVWAHFHRRNVGGLFELFAEWLMERNERRGFTPRKTICSRMNRGM